MQVLDAYLTNSMRTKDLPMVLNGNQKAIENFKKWKQLRNNCIEFFS